MQTRRDVYQAIADPTRREIIHLLSQQSLNLNAIADNFDLSRQAISLHIKVLTECGLITIRKQGRERFCVPRFEPLNEVAAWVGQYQAFWEARLDKMGFLLQEIQKKKITKPKN
jgi:DNA-binding transcriptional ArsR family regulator